jgi:hypothetical protein
MRFFVYIPMPLAAALGVEGGEKVSWELLDHKELHLVRVAPPPVKAGKRGGQRLCAHHPAFSAQPIV